MESRKDCAARLNGDGVSHPVSVCDELLQATIRVDFESHSFMCSVVREASSPAPQRESVEWSIAARGASLNVWSLSHRFESVGVFFAASRAQWWKHALSCVWCLVTLTRFSRVWRASHLHPANGVGSFQLVIASTCPPYPWRPGVPFLSRCRSLVGLDQPRNHDADHARNCEMAIMWRFRTLCSSALFDMVHAHHGIVNTFPTRYHALLTPSFIWEWRTMIFGSI